ncbi:hypothetical protein [Endozoicomonas sp. OPT23]|uniref:hypothetical protein n=1 Tax=Endozoicomonas sp. OPT23 TaxID=2072845 RepID=UPI001E2E0371|nr:hypothetical protein [Endozoicomonas sp. OPT23]
MLDSDELEDSWKTLEASQFDWLNESYVTGARLIQSSTFKLDELDANQLSAALLDVAAITNSDANLMRAFTEKKSNNWLKSPDYQLLGFNRFWKALSELQQAQLNAALSPGEAMLFQKSLQQLTGQILCPDNTADMMDSIFSIDLLSSPPDCAFQEQPEEALYTEEHTEKPSEDEPEVRTKEKSDDSEHPTPTLETKEIDTASNSTATSEPTAETELVGNTTNSSEATKPE